MNKKSIFILYLIVLTLLSILPINANTSIKLDNFDVELRLDYLAHFLLYCPFIFLFAAVHKTKVAYIILLGVLFVLLTEIAQYFIPYRSFNINDLMANVLGILLGLVVYIPFVSNLITKIFPRFSFKK